MVREPPACEFVACDRLAVAVDREGVPVCGKHEMRCLIC